MNQSLRIAVADDEPDMRAYFQKCLPRLGHQVVVVAENGRELVERALTTHPDLVITDIKMPDMDGIDAATQLYQQRPVPVILVSAFHDADLIERAKGILMKRAGLDEQEAFRRLQKLASEESRKLIDIARMILVAEKAVQPPEKG